MCIFAHPFLYCLMLPTNLRQGVFEAGCDEAGRGCLAGPVVAAAVILPDGFSHELLIDSKQLSHKQRCQARNIVIENAVAWAVCRISPQTIDEINILAASIHAMHCSLSKLSVKPGHILVDGNRFKQWDKETPFTTVVKGDSKYADIAAASILAKTYRDDWMDSLDLKFPVYGFSKHKGYPTRQHLNAIEKFGPCPFHRFTFRGVKKEPSLFDF